MVAERQRSGGVSPVFARAQIVRQPPDGAAGLGASIRVREDESVRNRIHGLKSLRHHRFHANGHPGARVRLERDDKVAHAVARRRPVVADGGRDERILKIQRVGRCWFVVVATDDRYDELVGSSVRLWRQQRGQSSTRWSNRSWKGKTRR
jgi:hypothetical protein